MLQTTAGPDLLKIWGGLSGVQQRFMQVIRFRLASEQKISQKIRKKAEMILARGFVTEDDLQPLSFGLKMAPNAVLDFNPETVDLEILEFYQPGIDDQAADFARQGLRFDPVIALKAAIIFKALIQMDEAQAAVA